jgi:hypothetical protein
MILVSERAKTVLALDRRAVIGLFILDSPIDTVCSFLVVDTLLSSLLGESWWSWTFVCLQLGLLDCALSVWNFSRWFARGFLFLFSTLKMEATSSSETSVDTISTQRQIPEHCFLHSHRRENLKSYNYKFIVIQPESLSLSVKLTVTGSPYIPLQLFSKAAESNS